MVQLPGDPVVVAPVQFTGDWSAASRPHAVLVDAADPCGGQYVGAKHLHPVAHVVDVRYHAFVAKL